MLDHEYFDEINDWIPEVIAARDPRGRLLAGAGYTHLRSLSEWVYACRLRMLALIDGDPRRIG